MAIVLAGVALTIAVPSRTVRVLDGVAMTEGMVLLVVPPAKRRTP
jgi:hypothetical protein